MLIISLRQKLNNIDGKSINRKDTGFKTSCSLIKDFFQFRNNRKKGFGASRFINRLLVSTVTALSTQQLLHTDFNLCVPICYLVRCKPKSSSRSRSRISYSDFDTKRSKISVVNNRAVSQRATIEFQQKGFKETRIQ